MPDDLTLNREQSRRVDRLAVERYGMTGLVLMENAGRGAAEIIARLYRALPSPAGPIVVACGKGRNGTEGAASAKPLSSAARSLDPARPKAILSAEQRRASRDILDADLSSRDVNVRRAAARAFSRIADSRSVEHLLKTLSDEDDEVVTWSAYGLGFSCRGREDGVVKRLSTRAASLLVAKTEDATAAPKTAKDGGVATRAPMLSGPLGCAPSCSDSSWRAFSASA